MTDINEFIQYLTDQIGQPYVWGAQGTELTRADYKRIIDRREEKEANRKAAKKFCEKKFAEGHSVLRAYDCSGLGMFWLQNIKHIFGYDMSANGMLNTCEQVSTAKRGYWVFHWNGTKATHIGYMVSDEEVIHAKGRAYGVVKEKFKKGTQWNRIGKPRCFKFDEQFVFTRVLQYGMKGEDVIEMKRLLIKAGFGDGITVNTASSQNFKSRTRNAVKAFQKAACLKVDGICGKDTILALGGHWK